MDKELKMDFSSAKPSIPKATKLAMRAKGKKVRVFSDWRYSQGHTWEGSWISQYVKAWA